MFLNRIVFQDIYNSIVIILVGRTQRKNISILIPILLIRILGIHYIFILLVLTRKRPIALIIFDNNASNFQFLLLKSSAFISF